MFGANGRTGSEIIDLASSRGHLVTAFVRSPQMIIPNRSVTGVQGDPRYSETMIPTLGGHDAVLSAIGPHPREAFGPSTLVTDCARATQQAMKACGVARLAILSAAVLFLEKRLCSAFFKGLITHHARDLRGMESLMQSSGLDWTVARPPRLTKSTNTRFRALPNALPPGSRAMSFRFVAAFMLEAIERRSRLREIVGWGS